MKKILPQRLLLSCLLLSLPVKAADYFLDSINGNDTNSGTAYYSPWKTVAKFTSVAGVNCSNTSIRVARSSYFREELRLGNGNSVMVYGSGPRPVFDASEIVTNWTQVCVAINTNIYCVSSFVVDGGGDTTTVPAIEDGTIMIAATSILNCDATPGSFYSIPGPLAGSTNTIFIHPSGSTSPDGRRYEVAKRNYGIVAGDNCRIESVVTRNQMNNNGSLEIGKDCLVRDVLVENGTKHNMLFQSGRLEDVVAWKASHYQGQTIPIVNYSQTDGLAVDLLRCMVIGISPSRLVSDGFYGHTANVSANPGYAYAKFEDCMVTLAGGFGTVSMTTNGFQVFNHCITRGTSTRGFVTYGGHNVLLNCEFQTIPDVHFSQSGSPVQIFGGAGARTYISGLKCSVPAWMSPYNIRISANNAWLSVTDSIIGHGGTIGISSVGTTNITLSVSNSVINSGVVYQFTGQLPAFTANNNCYTDGAIAFHWGSEVYINWSQYRVLVGSNDTHTTTNLAQWVGWPVSGDYRYSASSPIVTNLAGPGWGMSKRQSTHQLLQEINPWLPPNLATGKP